jgi:hypothetical protein
MGRQHAVVEHQINAWAWAERGQLLEQLQRLEHELAGAVSPRRVHVRVLLGFQRHRARRHGIRDGRAGSVTVIQRFGGGLNLNVHYHTLLFDGVFFTNRANGALDFRPLPPPTTPSTARTSA